MIEHGGVKVHVLFPIIDTVYLKVDILGRRHLVVGLADDVAVNVCDIYTESRDRHTDKQTSRR